LTPIQGKVLDYLRTNGEHSVADVAAGVKVSVEYAAGVLRELQRLDKVISRTKPKSKNQKLWSAKPAK
jgi:hypothetical protein